MAKLYTMDICLVGDSDASLLSPERRNKALRYIHSIDRKLSIAASLLIARGLVEYGVNERDVEYAYNEYGKPYFKSYPSIHFSISHSGTMAACAFSERAVGCDIEILRPYDDDVARACFTPFEREDIFSMDDRAYGFTRLWTAKESFLKALGTGLALPMQNFSIRFIEDEIVLEENIDKRMWKITTEMVDNHIIAICEED